MAKSVCPCRTSFGEKELGSWNVCNFYMRMCNKYMQMLAEELKYFSIYCTKFLVLIKTLLQYNWLIALLIKTTVGGNLCK